MMMMMMMMTTFIGNEKCRTIFSIFYPKILLKVTWH